MKLASFGDMAQTWALRRQGTSLNQQLVRLTEELSTGKTADLTRHLGGDYRYLSDIERSLVANKAYENAASEAQGFSAAMQAALGSIQGEVEQLTGNLLSAEQSTAESRKVVAENAEVQFAHIISSLNSHFAGRALFAGDATSGQALADAETILQNVRAEVAGKTTAEDIRAAVETWFESTAGFETSAYVGSHESLTPFRLGGQDRVHLDLRADAAELRAVMAEVAITVMSADVSDPQVQISLQKNSAEGLLNAQGGLTALRSDLGFAEARIEEIGTRLASERVSLNYAKEALLGVDQFETATNIENVQFQLEALYTVTSRLSGLSLVNFL